VLRQGCIEGVQGHLDSFRSLEYVASLSMKDLTHQSIWTTTGGGNQRARMQAPTDNPTCPVFPSLVYDLIGSAFAIFHPRRPGGRPPGSLKGCTGKGFIQFDSDDTTTKPRRQVHFLRPVTLYTRPPLSYLCPIFASGWKGSTSSPAPYEAQRSG
jgi:hypothetical protein